MPAPPCPPGCQCGKHRRSDYHNRQIGESVAYTAAQRGLSTHPETVARRKRQHRQERL